ncbi:hydrolase, putative [alpha proteobacterium BAL199]|jgi:HAD superfamily hydrolase (TIGR01509 family)|nr:hydrolase, putative [alpha proteobacterium BAL199]
MYLPHVDYDAVVFDCDGVLIDSERLAVAILRDDLTEFGLRLSEEEVHHRFTGWLTAQIAVTVAAETGMAIPPDWVRRHNALVREAVANGVEPIDGVIKVLDALDANGIGWGVASQSDPSYLERGLGRVGIWQRAPGRVASAQTVARPKPAPDVYLKAMELVGATPDRTIVVEDSPTGVRAGVAAGARVIGFSADRAPGDLISAGALDTVPAMTALLVALGLNPVAVA